MGVWGTGIHENDVSEDLKDFYIACLKAGKKDEEALKETLEDFQNEIDDDEDAIDTYISLADIMWKYGRLVPEIKEKALEMIEREKVLKRFEGKLLDERMKKLAKLKEQLEKDMPKRKKVSVHKPYVLGMQEGDVYCYEITPAKEERFRYRNECVGKYLVFEVLKVYKKDWHIKGIFDERAYLRFWMYDEKIGDISQLRFEDEKSIIVDLCETSKRFRPKNLYCLGNAYTLQNYKNINDVDGYIKGKYRNDRMIFYLSDDYVINRISLDLMKLNNNLQTEQ